MLLIMIALKILVMTNPLLKLNQIKTLRKMIQDNPFAKLGDLDQKLYQETTPKPHVEEIEKRVEKEPKEKVSLLANQQTSKLVKKKTSKLVNQQTNKLASSQSNLQPLSTKEKKKYGTYLREDSISKIQLH